MITSMCVDCPGVLFLAFYVALRISSAGPSLRRVCCHDKWDVIGAVDDMPRVFPAYYSCEYSVGNVNDVLNMPN